MEFEPVDLQVVPDFYKFETGPNPMFFRYTPGTRAFIQCSARVRRTTISARS